MLARWYGGASNEPDDVNARLLQGLTALLQTFPVAPTAATTVAPVHDGPREQRAARRRGHAAETSLLEDLRRLLDRLMRPNAGGDFIQRLRRFVQAAERRSETAAVVQAATDPIEDWRAEQEPASRGPVPPWRPRPPAPKSGSAARAPRLRGRGVKPLAQPRLPAATVVASRPAVEGTAWREQLPSRPAAPVPIALCPSHWKGTLVGADDFVSAVNAAGSGDSVICGVCSEVPPGTTGLLVPPDVTATLVLLPAYYRASRPCS